uniref:hypothetical protein n=1 Tax=uncultured Acetatifactor sp. TaxID=1671927 RepID=UPI002601632C
EIFPPEKDILPKESFLPERDFLPEEIFPLEKDFLPEESFLPEKDFLPKEIFPPEKDILPKESFLPEKDFPPKESSLPEKVSLSPGRIWKNGRSLRKTCREMRRRKAFQGTYRGPARAVRGTETAPRRSSPEACPSEDVSPWARAERI